MEAERKASGAGWGIGRGRRGGGGRTNFLESRLHILPPPLPSPSFPMEGTLHPLPLLFSPQGTKGRREEGIPPTAHTPMHPPPPSCSQSQSPSSKAPEGRKSWRRPSLDCPRTTTTAKKGGIMRRREEGGAARGGTAAAAASDRPGAPTQKGRRAIGQL